MRNSEEIKKLIGIIERLIDISFSVPSEIDGDASCFYCAAYLQGGESHEEDCPYIEAKRILDNNQEITWNH